MTKQKKPNSVEQSGQGQYVQYQEEVEIWQDQHRWEMSMGWIWCWLGGTEQWVATGILLLEATNPNG